MAKGMKSLEVHRDALPKNAALRSALAEAQAKSSETDPERAARRLLDAAMQKLTPNAAKFEFKAIGIDKVPFSDSHIIKFRQHYNKIPVYGSLVSVEIGKGNDLVSIDSSVGEPVGIDPVASISPAQALAVACREAGYSGEGPSEQPRLNFYFDRTADRWRLVYIVEDLLRRKPRSGIEADSHAGSPQHSDFVIDAHSGELVVELPRTQGAEASGTSVGRDLLGQDRTLHIRMKSGSSRKWLFDAERNIHTHDFGFRQIDTEEDQLPGSYVEIPPEPWDAAAVSAHANTRIVADFLINVFQRDGIDGEGGKIISSVNCTKSGDSNGKEWKNAQRLPTQMAYGQRMVGNQLRSYAASLEIVAHELLHGVTDRTARLEYRLQSGALNESYSDILGVIVANRDEPDIGRWEWRIGDEMRELGDSIRNLANPSACGQPMHMDDFLHLPDDDENDHGGVHKNSGIHNKAAHNIFTAKQGGGFLFAPMDVARIFYVTLVSRLSRTSEFVDSRRGVLLTARSMFASDPFRDNKLKAIKKAFDKVGIVDAGAIT